MKTKLKTHTRSVDVMQDPIDILMKEHEEALKYVNQLREAVEYITTHGFSLAAFQQINEAIQFIDIEIRQHHDKEEKYLFPLLEPYPECPWEVMRLEHRELWKAFRALQSSIKDIEDLRIYGTSIPDLLKTSTAVVDLVTSHIAKENDILFPMAKKLLSLAEYKRLQQNMARAVTSVS